MPRDPVRLGDAGARQVVVELVPEEASPRRSQALGGVGQRAEPGGGCARLLGRLGEPLVARVPALHPGVRGVAARAVQAQQQLAAVGRKPLGGEARAQLAQQLVRAHGARAQGPGVVRRLLQDGERARRGRAPLVAGAEEAHRQRLVQQLLVPPDLRFDLGVLGGRELERLPVAARVQQCQQARAVEALPPAEREGDAEGRAHVAVPAQLGGGEAQQAAVRGQHRHVRAEAEAVGEEEIARVAAELAAEPATAEQAVANERLGRGQVDVERVPGGARHLPVAGLDVAAQLGELGGVVLLQQRVAEGAVEVDAVGGELREGGGVLAHRRGEEARDRVAHRPAPLRVEVGDGDEVQRARERLRAWGGRGGGAVGRCSAGQARRSRVRPRRAASARRPAGWSRAPDPPLPPVARRLRQPRRVEGRCGHRAGIGRRGALAIPGTRASGTLGGGTLAGGTLAGGKFAGCISAGGTSAGLGPLSRPLAGGPGARRPSLALRHALPTTPPRPRPRYGARSGRHANTQRASGPRSGVSAPRRRPPCGGVALAACAGRGPWWAGGNRRRASGV